MVLDIEASDMEGNTPLHAAVITDATEIVELLLKHRANTKAKGVRGMTPLHYAAAVGRKRAVEQLLDFNADIDALCQDTPWAGMGPLRGLRQLWMGVMVLRMQMYSKTQ